MRLNFKNTTNQPMRIRLVNKSGSIVIDEAGNPTILQEDQETIFCLGPAGDHNRMWSSNPEQKMWEDDDQEYMWSIVRPITKFPMWNKDENKLMWSANDNDYMWHEEYLEGRMWGRDETKLMWNQDENVKMWA